MTTLENRPNTALLVIDVQNGVVAGAHDRDAVVGNVAGLVDRARARRRAGGVGAALRRWLWRRAATSGASIKEVNGTYFLFSLRPSNPVILNGKAGRGQRGAFRR